VWEGRQIVEVARKYNRICQTGTQIRSNPGVRDAIAFVQSGKLGALRLARGLCYKRRPSIGKVDGPQEPPKTMDYDLWCGPAPLKPPHRKTRNGTVHYDWHWIWDYGNGDLGNQGIHQMDVARWGLGSGRLANSVFSLGGRFGYVDDGETANTQIALFDYGDAKLIFEVRGLETTDWLADVRDQPTPRKDMQARVGNVFECADGYLICGSYDSAVACTKDWEVVKVFHKGADHFANFVEAVRARDPKILHADIEEGHLSSALCHLANISYRLGTEQPLASDLPGADPDVQEAVRRMKEHLQANHVPPETTACRVGPKLAFDPKAERFAGNQPKANAMLTREYRKGFEVPQKV
ncbi:MAG TPA: gfo/Idh/MocA family oxidoreductase, partial [Gemmataceae bacterium]